MFGMRHGGLDSAARSTFVASFSAAFRKQFAMDFYITKYQGKQMEALTPLFQSMLGGVHRLEAQEISEKKEAASKSANTDDLVEPAAKARKTHEDLRKRARRLTTRLAAMANRCYWLSATEVAVFLLTGGDCLQTHNNQRLFTRQLQWALQQCKRMLNGDIVAQQPPAQDRPIEAISVHLPAQPKATSTDGSCQLGANSATSEH